MAGTILLINLPTSAGFLYNLPGTIYPATGILLVGAMFKSRGYGVKVIDGCLHPDYESRALAAVDNNTVMICFSVTTNQVPMALRLSRQFKQRYPEVPVVWGGIHCILFPEQTVSDEAVDIVATGDGTLTVQGLCDYLDRKSVV